MTITLKPTTEAMLREKARLNGQDLDTLVDALIVEALTTEAREQRETAAAIQTAMEAVAAGREKPIEQYLAEQRAKRGLPDTWPSASLIQTDEGMVMAE